MKFPSVHVKIEREREQEEEAREVECSHKLDWKSICRLAWARARRINIDIGSALVRWFVAIPNRVRSEAAAPDAIPRSPGWRTPGIPIAAGRFRSGSEDVFEVHRRGAVVQEFCRILARPNGPHGEGPEDHTEPVAAFGF